MSKKAPGRYCLAICYCGECDQYKPLPRNDAAPSGKPSAKSRAAQTWSDREDSTWIDKL